ncbi:MAG: bifunctional phosphopantothenoylcysteine decarboxylase/phosphopantothenate--cysteine ligase CoaBC [Candidatus Wallbacteria bacterium]|nr:bifunctional phosphopantothenoylcysteine decarboxylase/phosphopantothenate--cysteine ligase CoaBC [Candidatus Wallbacteria bacterium]
MRNPRPDNPATSPTGAGAGRVLLGVTGGIAAYKACELVRLLVKAGHAVRVVMTRAAAEFVGPLTFATLTGHPVALDAFGPEGWRMEHLELARWADAMVVAPATADVLAKLASGAADDLLSTTHLAFDRELLVAPAMNATMWSHPAVVENRRRLEARGVGFVGPREGETACGETGIGPMAEPAEIAARVAATLARTHDLAGRQVLVTAGPRFLSNPSTGQMGIELAREAARRGARVCLVHGPLSGGPPPSDIPAAAVINAQQMYDAVMERVASADVFIGAAAVSDFRPVAPSASKIKKEGRRTWTLELERAPDILEAVGRQRRPHQVVVGFALETRDLIRSARKKLQEKRADLIVANGAGEGERPFGDRESHVFLVGARGEPSELPLQSKRLVAQAVFDRVKGLLDG